VQRLGGRRRCCGIAEVAKDGQRSPLAAASRNSARGFRRGRNSFREVGGPDGIAVEGDMLPTERRDVSEKLVGNDFATRAQLVAAEIGGEMAQDRRRWDSSALD
jgi:hypothetical protein